MFALNKDSIARLLDRDIFQYELRFYSVKSKREVKSKDTKR